MFKCKVKTSHVFNSIDNVGILQAFMSTNGKKVKNQAAKKNPPGKGGDETRGAN
jgi:hypothetical protein